MLKKFLVVVWWWYRVIIVSALSLSLSLLEIKKEKERRERYSLTIEQLQLTAWRMNFEIFTDAISRFFQEWQFQFCFPTMQASSPWYTHFKYAYEENIRITLSSSTALIIYKHMCRFIWRARWSDLLNARSHSLHWNGRSPLV